MRRNVIVSIVLAVLIAVVQLVLGNGIVVALVSAAIAFVVALGVLALASRLGRPDL